MLLWHRLRSILLLINTKCVKQRKCLSTAIMSTTMDTGKDILMRLISAWSYSGKSGSMVKKFLILDAMRDLLLWTLVWECLKHFYVPPWQYPKPILPAAREFNVAYILGGDIDEGLIKRANKNLNKIVDQMQSVTESTDATSTVETSKNRESKPAKPLKQRVKFKAFNFVAKEATPNQMNRFDVILWYACSTNFLN